MTHNATRQLAEFVASTPLSHIPDAVIDRAKYFVLDYLVTGCEFSGGHTLPTLAMG